MTDERLKALFDKHNFLTLGAESDYMLLGKKAYRLCKKIEKYNLKLLFILNKECALRRVNTFFEDENSNEQLSCSFQQKNLNKENSIKV